MYLRVLYKLFLLCDVFFFNEVIDLSFAVQSQQKHEVLWNACGSLAVSSMNGHAARNALAAAHGAR
jgi:hypothetical protein